MNLNSESNRDHTQTENILQTQFSLTAEEIRLLKQCNQDGIISRAIPLSLISGGAVYWAIKNNKIQPRIFGLVGSVITSGLTGFFIGRLTYGMKCAQEVLNMPNSSYMQFKEKMKNQEEQQYGHDVHNPDHYAPYQQRPDDYRPSVSDLDTHPMSSFDPYTSSYNDQPRTNDDPVIEPKTRNFAGSYSDLRKQNRKDYIDSMWDTNLPPENEKSNNPNRNFQAPNPNDFDRRQPVTQEPEFPHVTGRKTKYGDYME